MADGMRAGDATEVARGARAARTRPSSSPPRPPTGAGVLLSLWALACVLMLIVAVRDDNAPAWKLPPASDAAPSASSVRSSPVYAPSVGLDGAEEALDEALGASTAPKATIALVETLPVGQFNATPAGPETFDALLARVEAATESIDISAMYWNLLGKDDRAVFSAEEMRQFGADRGLQLFDALRDAAERGVTLQILTAKQAPGGAQAQATSSRNHSAEEEQSALPDEVAQLVKAAPERVRVRCWSGPEWYGSGILHQKLWLFDRRHLYVGSANMDWKSLAQVMEAGVLLQDLSPKSPVIQDVGKLFDAWWLWADPALALTTGSYYSDAFQLQLQVPSWSPFLPADTRRPDPFTTAGLASLGNISHQLHASLAFDGAAPASPAHLFVAAAPMEATAARSRAFDEDALVYTIRSATSRVSLSVMDLAPYSMYTPGPIWWPALTDALLAGLFSKPGLRVRLLVSEWQHTNPQMLDALRLLREQGALCRKMRAACSGSLEIRLFRVPGWQDTVSTRAHKARWPEHSRVNHAKYIVTDARVNVGTSNMEWGYFYTTAGASVNTDHEPTRRAFEALFDRNWDSPYAQPLVG